MEDVDIDELVSSLTPREENSALKSYQNTVSVPCPACEEPFDDLVVCEDDLTSLELSMVLDLCVTTHDDDVLLVTHGTPSGTIVKALCDEEVTSELTCNAGYGLHYNTGLTALDVSETPTIAFGNDTSHLEPGQITSNSTYVD